MVEDLSNLVFIVNSLHPLYYLVQNGLSSLEECEVPPTCSKKYKLASSVQCDKDTEQFLTVPKKDEQAGEAVNNSHKLFERGVLPTGLKISLRNRGRISVATRGALSFTFAENFLLVLVWVASLSAGIWLLICI